MPKFDRKVESEAQHLVKHILDKDYENWKLDNLPYIRNFVDTEWPTDLLTRVAWARSVIDAPPEYIEKDIIGPFSEEYEDLINTIRNMEYSEDEGDKEINRSTLAEAIIDFFDIAKSGWEKEDLKEKRRYMLDISYRTTVHRNKYNCILHIMGFFLAAVRLTFTNNEGEFSFRKSNFPMKFRQENPSGPAKRSRIPVVTIGEDSIQPEDIPEILAVTVDIDAVARACSSMIFNTILKDWKKSVAHLEKEIDEDPDFPFGRERITNDSTLILKDLKPIISAFLLEDKVDEITQARLSLVQATLDSLKGALSNFDDNIVLQCNSLEFALKAMGERIYSQTEELDKTPLLPVSLSSSMESASPSLEKSGLDSPNLETNGEVIPLPFTSAPKVDSEFDLKTRPKPEKWDPNSRTLWHHLELIMISCLDLGILDYKQKLNFIFGIFENEYERGEFSNKILKKFNNSASISEEQFNIAINETCTLFDPTNMRSSDFYKTRLGEDARCRQKSTERLRTFMKRLSEWYGYAFPESHESHSQKLALCRKFFDGLYDKSLANVIAKTQKGYAAVHLDADPWALVKILEETEQRIIQVKENEMELRLSLM